MTYIFCNKKVVLKLRKKLSLLHVSRAIVPVLVMLYHVSVNMKDYWDYNFLGFTSLTAYGGVHYFFALSGFMLFYIYRSRFGIQGQWKKFLIHRFIRIYPLYWILTLIAAMVLLFFPFLGHDIEINYQTFIFSLLLIPNPNGTMPILDVAWFLIYIVYYYLIFSVFFSPNRFIPRIVFSIWLLITVGFMTDIFWTQNSVPYYFFYDYNLIFAGGMLCAYLLNKIKLNFLLSILICGLGLISLPFLWINEWHHWIPIRYDLGLGIASVFILFGLASIDLQKDITIPSWANYLGNASLSIYLAHNLPLNTFSHLFYKFRVFEVIGGVATSIILLVLITFVGCLVHSYIEKPVVSILKKRI